MYEQHTRACKGIQGRAGAYRYEGVQGHTRGILENTRAYEGTRGHVRAAYERKRRGHARAYEGIQEQHTRTCKAIPV